MYDDDDMARRAGWSAQAKLERARKALAGDTKAKAQIDAEDTGIAARKAVNALEDKAAKGDSAALTQLRAIAQGKASPAAAQSSASSAPTKAGIDVAVKAAVARERERVSAVFKSKHSRGRERACIGILTAKENYSAETIILQLPKISLDADVEAKARQEQLDRHAATWDRARRANNESAPAKQNESKAASSPVSSDPWAKAYARLNEERAA